MLGIIWFILIAVLFIGYSIFDGFDLGAGTLYPFIAKTDSEKAAVRQSIGPVWDGNEVWLLTAGGALFAAFPAVYASVFSGFYLALMLVLFCLIARAAALEFGAHDPKWRKVWDTTFFVGSALPSLLFGVAAGNIFRGIPLAANGDFTGNFFTLLNPFSLVCGLTGLCWFILQGSSWISLKTTGTLASRARSIRKSSAIVVVIIALLALGVAALLDPDVFARSIGRPAVWIAGIVFLVGSLLAFLGHAKGDSAEKTDLRSFIGSCISGVGLVAMWACSIFPALVPSTDVGPSLTIANSASSDLTLTVMLIITLIGLPLVLLYITLIYRAFRGRIDSNQELTY